MINRPNVILINCDDLGYGDLGCYDSVVNKTPAIDEMAAGGIRLTDFYAASAVCSPSRAAMLTGCYPPRIGFGEFDGRTVLFPGQGIGLDPSEATLAKILKEVGYHTKIIGKWHCGDQKKFLPLAHGFDEYYGLPYSNDMGRQVGGSLDYPPLPLIEGNDVIQEQPDQRGLTERYVEQAIKFIRANRDGNFFLYLAHMHVHLPLYAAETFVRQSKNGDYGACVEEIDWSVSVMRHELKKLGLEKNTIVIFTSDNGCRGDNGGSNRPLRGCKAQTYEGGFRVPCIVYWPEAIKEGFEYSGIMSSLDFYRTLGVICGAKIPDDRINDSLDFSALFKGEKYFDSPRKSFFYYFKNGLEAVRYGDWKLHVHKADAKVNELYNLVRDIGETENLYDSRPDIAAKLTEMLLACAEDIGDSYAAKTGANVRKHGTVDKPEMLTQYDIEHPYICAMYDKEEMG